MKEVMYDQSSLLIAGVLLVSMLAAIEIGFRIGKRFQHDSDETSRNHISAIQASMLGVLALLIGFTFSLALQRYDSRSAAVVDEANAIGTAYLRAQILPEAVRGDVLQLLRRYTDLRVESGTISLAEEDARQVLLGEATEALDSLWAYARAAAALEPNPVTTGLFIQALNELIDSYGRRDAALSRHVPELVLFLLYGTFILIGSIIGFSCGLNGHRASYATYIMVALIVLLVFIIIDLDRPRRGLIEVSQRSMIELRDAMAKPLAPLPVLPLAPAPAGATSGAEERAAVP